jgi:hypothetical protein
LPSLFCHSGRDIQAEDGCAHVPQIPGDMTGATAHIAYFATSCDFSSETVEQLSVKRLMLKLVENPACVLVGEAIIAFANRGCDVVRHSSRARLSE